MTPRSLRLLVILPLSVLVGPLAAAAQPAGPMARIGVLDLGHSSPAAVDLQRAFRHTLHELGWVEGHNLTVEWRWSEGARDRLPDLAAELVRLQVDVITATGGDAIRAAQQAPRTIPIVMLGTTDPVGSGFVASLARPGGNITGVSTLQADLTLKRLELLKEAVPGISRVAILRDTGPGGINRALVRDQARAERALGVQRHLQEVPDPSAPEPAFAAIRQARADALMVLPSQRLGAYATRIVDLVARSRLPAIYPAREYVEAGGLMSYARDRAEEFRRAAAYVDKILKGAKPADLPVEQPTTLLLVINLKTAQALGLTIPPTFLFQATEVLR
jgi:putative tryptophan/tyrosine transport system substrate-binding protein